MNKKRFISLLLAAFISAASLSSVLAAPTPTPGTTTSTVTSPDGTTKTVTSEGNPVTSPTPTSSADSDNSDDSDNETETLSPAPSATPDSAATSTPQLEAGITMEDPTLTPPKISYAQSALLMDMKTGRVLYSKNLDDCVFPASTTKIMTGILALEMGNAEDVVTVPYEAIKDITLQDSMMGLLVGEELTMDQLIKGMLVYSANDAANVIAVHLAGSMDNFVELMNQKAQELGMTGTHFVNPCGSHNDDHYTTARDLAILSKYAMKNEQFREIVKMPIYKIPPTNKYTSERILVNTNLFLGTSRSSYYYYPPATGIKTGHTSQAGYCLVSSASYNETELLAIVMNCKNVDTKEQAYSYIDSRALFEFGFENYKHTPLASVGDIINDSKVYEAKHDMRVAVTVEEDIQALIPSKNSNEADITKTVNMPEKIKAPIKKGDVVGSVSYYYRGIEVGSTNLVATNDVERNNFLHIFHIITGIIFNPLFFIPAILLILVYMYARHQKKKRERQRRIQQLKRNRQRTAPDNETGTRTPDRNASRTQRVDHSTKASNSRYRK